MNRKYTKEQLLALYESDEPIFIIRAKDILAHPVIAAYIGMYSYPPSHLIQTGIVDVSQELQDEEALDALIEHLHAVDDWQEENNSKVQWPTPANTQTVYLKGQITEEREYSPLSLVNYKNHARYAVREHNSDEAFLFEKISVFNDEQFDAVFNGCLINVDHQEGNNYHLHIHRYADTNNLYQSVVNNISLFGAVRMAIKIVIQAARLDDKPIESIQAPYLVLKAEVDSL